MPPSRLTQPSKILKTERTHEENQERAYIAASRRSDRSLEARVESARRASEIHKKRTGRSLRVTEQDVVNEEMYEEEDDDLPLHYRRLTAHLQTGSPDFNQKLSAYLANHVAMRSALDQAINASYAQQYPNAPQFAHNQQPFPPIRGQASMPTRFSLDNDLSYLTPSNTNMKPDFLAQTTTGDEYFAKATNAQMPTPATSDGSLQSRAKIHRISTSADNSPVTSTKVLDPLSDKFQADLGPFSLALPTESQIMLSGVFDPRDPLTTAFMPTNTRNNPSSPSRMASASKPRSFSQSCVDSHTIMPTLAPSAFEKAFRGYDPLSMIDTASPPAPPTNQAFDSDSTDYFLAPVSTAETSQGAGTLTPGANANWEAFIDQSSWANDLS